MCNVKHILPTMSSTITFKKLGQRVCAILHPGDINVHLIFTQPLYVSGLDMNLFGDWEMDHGTARQ